jgi:hypothetical protein
MAKILKDIYVSWTWEGDEMLLEGFNVAIAPQGSDPNTEAIIIQKTSSEKTDILNRGTTQYEHIFRNITLNKDTNYIAWVQSLTDGFDSEWLSATGINVSDDGKATIATTDADGNPITSSGGDVTIDSAGITVVNGAFKLVNSSGSITIDNTGITANDGSKDTFKIDSNGNASFSGSINVGSNIAGVDTSAEDLETVSGSTSKSTTAETNAKKYADDESKWVSTNHRFEADIEGPGWVRIASNPGDRAHATFKIRDTDGGKHNSLEFKLGCSYNQRGNADFQMVSFSRYSILSISGVRLLTNGTYDPMYVEVFFTGATSGVRCEITDNIQSNGWNPVEFDNGVIPAGYASTEWDVDVNSVTIDGRGIRTTGSDGDYSILSDDSLLFYENGSSIPHDYSKRVASGIAQNGDYISLGWDKAPKVTTAIKQLRSYTGSYSNRNQTYSCYHSAPSASGFYVYGRSVVLGGTTKNTINTNISASSIRSGSECYGYTYTPGSADWVWPGSTVNGSTYLRVRFNVTSSSSNNVLRFYYKRTTSSSWIYHKGYTNPSTGVRDIAMDLAAGEYHFRFNISCSTGSLSINVVECEYRASDLNIATGEVMWLAIEGGSD